MKPSTFGPVFVLGLGIACALPSLASAPAERVVCTQAPRTQWLSEARIREIFGVQDFSLVKLKISSGKCYEFYAVHRDGSLVEAYYDPVTGQEVRRNHIPARKP